MATNVCEWVSLNTGIPLCNDGTKAIHAPLEAIEQRGALKSGGCRLAKRTIILHYHLFKNAGTSLDLILKRNFPERWVTREFPRNRGDNSSMVADWIRSDPDAVAFSSHSMSGPLPVVEGVDIVSVIFLRDPVARIASAYRFERKQDATTVGANLAKQHDLEGYVRSRLAIPGDRQCRNFQTQRLATFVPGPEPELVRAKKALSLLSLVGSVERFDDALLRLDEILKVRFPNFDATTAHTNVSEKTSEQLDSSLKFLLEENNKEDRQLLQQFYTLTPAH